MQRNHKIYITAIPLIVLLLFVLFFYTAVPATRLPDKSQSSAVNIPILLYHNLSKNSNGKMTISEKTFQEHMEAISSHGYQTISFQELLDFVEGKASLPQKPIMITFDDGYMSNYTMAYPVLSQLNMKSTIFVIGVTFGADTYKDTGKKMTPHFGSAEAEEMISSGLVSIQSHSFDMHQVKKLDDPISFRKGVLQRDDEGDADYARAFKEDYEKSKKVIENLCGQESVVFSYPYGLFNQKTEAWLSESGIKITLTIEEKTKNKVEIGNMESLKLLGRYSIGETYSAEKLLEKLEK